MRQVSETTQEYLKLPLQIELRNDPAEEAAYFASAWKAAKTEKERDSVLRGLLFAGGRWDIITRSMSIYPDFERLAGQDFPGLWR